MTASTISKEQVIDVLKQVHDPEVMVDIWTMGLIYDIIIGETIKIVMTLTTPTCPYGPMLLDEVKTQVGQLGKRVEIQLTFDPPWKPSDELRMMLGV